MAPKQATSKLDVHFTNTATPHNSKASANKLPFFLRTSGISGVVDISGMGNTVDSLRICLQGTLSIRIPQRQRPSYGGVDAGATYRKLSRTTLILVQNVPARESSFGVEHTNTSLPFHLDLTGPNDTCSPSTRSTKALLPTLCYRNVTSSPTSTQAETTEVRSSYVLSISVMNDNSIMETISQPVRIFDNSSLEPPAYQAISSSAYPSQQSGTFRRNLFTKTGKLSAMVPSEPSPLVFDSQNDFANTTIPVQLAAATPDSFSDLDACITWRLRTSTVASLIPMNSCPTAYQACDTSKMTSTSSLGLKHKIKMKLGNWTRIDGVYSSSQSLAIALPKSALLIPTTHSEHIARQYSVQVEISVRGKDVGRANVCVEIPMQIGYQDASDLNAPRYQERDEQIDCQARGTPSWRRARDYCDATTTCICFMS